MALLSYLPHAAGAGCSPVVVVGSSTTSAGDGGPADQAQLLWPQGLARDASGNIYIADTGNNKVRKVGTDGIIRTIAGTGARGGAGDSGPAIQAQLDAPDAIAIGADGSIFIAEQASRVRRIRPGGIIETYAGIGDPGYSGDGGAATAARLNNPTALVVDADGNLYIADRDNNRVRKVATNGTITTFAGSGDYGLHVPPAGSALPAKLVVLSVPQVLAVGPDGAIYMGDGHGIEAVKPDGTLRMIALDSGYPSEGGQAINTRFAGAYGLAVMPTGDLLVSFNRAVWRIDANGIEHQYASTYDGYGLIALPGGSILITAGSSVLRYAAELPAQGPSSFTVFAGAAAVLTDNPTQGASGVIYFPKDLSTDTAGNLLIADSYAGRIRKLDVHGILTTVAGNGTGGGSLPSPEGTPALQTPVTFPQTVGNQNGEVYFGEYFRVRKVKSDQTVVTVAGDGYLGGDTSYGASAIPATSTSVVAGSMAFDATGNLFVSDPFAYVIWRISPDGLLRVFKTLSGPATLVTADPSGMIYFLEQYPTPTLYKVNSDLTFSSVRDLQAYFRPAGSLEAIALDASGNLFATSSGNAVYRLSPSGTFTNIVASVVTGRTNYFPSLALDRNGTLYVGDATAQRIWKIPQATSCEGSTLQPQSVTIGVAGTNKLIQASVDGLTVTLPQTFSWYPNSQHRVSVTTRPNSDPALTFQQWTDGDLELERILTVGQASATYALQYESAIQTGLAFYPITPCRAVDTRADQAARGTLGPPSLTAGQARSFAIPNSACGVPATAKAYSLNATVVAPGPMGYLTLFPAGSTQPFVSTLNAVKGGAISNAAIVPAGTSGAISAYVTHNTDLILDVNGYFDTPGAANGLLFVPVTPYRFLDTRDAGQSAVAPGGIVSALNGSAAAYSVNLTVVPQEPLGYLTSWAAGAERPFVSTLNSFDGRIVANAAIVPAGDQGAISIYATNRTHVVGDTNGYFASASQPGGSSFYPLTPCRVVDTRLADAALGGPTLQAATSRSFIPSLGGCNIPGNARAYVLNVTVVPRGFLGYVTIWPAGAPMPLVSTLNSLDGRILANAAIVPAGANGGISVYATDTTDVVIDINGYFGQ